MGYNLNIFTGQLDLTGSGGSGDVVGPSGGSTDNAAARFDGATGKKLQDSLVIIDDSGNIVTPGDVSATNVNADTVNTTTLNADSVETTDLNATGTVTFVSLDLQGNKITNVDDPTTSADAANKHYVDGAIAAIPAPLIYKGTWDASSNTPPFANTDVGKTGFLYYVSAAGTVDFGAGPISFDIGDKVVNNGTTWDKWDNTDAVTSVNGQVGAVVVNAINQTTGDVTSGPATASQSVAATVAKIQGTTVSGTTGSGNVVFSASPTLTGTIVAAAANFSGAISASNFSGSSSGTNTGDQTIALTGDVTGVGTGSITTTIANGVITDTQVANAAGIFLNKLQALNSDIVPVSDVDGFLVSSSVTNTELGYVSGVTSSIQTQLNTLSGAAITSLTGDVTASGPGAAASTIGANKVTNSQLAQVPANTFKGNNTGITANAADLTVAQAKALLGITTAGSPGDISETSFAGANNVSSPASVTGLAFSNAVVRSFRSQVSVFINASTPLYEVFTLDGVQKGSTWNMAQTSTGDTTGIEFSITTSGQVRYTNLNYTGFVAMTTKFRAETLSV